jgi:TonB family protein
MLSLQVMGTNGPHRNGGSRSGVSVYPPTLILAAVVSVACGQPVQISPDEGQPPRLTWSPPLVYPPEMFRSDVEGRVVLEAMIDTSGKVEPGTVSVVSSTRSSFEQPAIDMLRNSRFEPGRTLSRAIRTQVRVPVLFDLKRASRIAKADSAAAAGLVSDGVRLAQQGRMQDALTAYSAAQGIDARLNGSVGFWYGLCWHGSVWGYASDVMFACDQAVALAPRQARTREARGIARALTSDFAGAIDDLEESAARASVGAIRTRLLTWIRLLRSGENPFNESVLDRLRRPTS